MQRTVLLCVYLAFDALHKRYDCHGISWWGGRNSLKFYIQMIILKGSLKDCKIEQKTLYTMVQNEKAFTAKIIEEWDERSPMIFCIAALFKIWKREAYQRKSHFWQVSIKDFKSVFRECSCGCKNYWLSPASLQNSTRVIIQLCIRCNTPLSNQ